MPGQSDRLGCGPMGGVPHRRRAGRGLLVGVDRPALVADLDDPGVDGYAHLDGGAASSDGTE